MGCFSYLCKKSGKPINSSSFRGDKCHIFLLKGGKVVEEMHGNYDSYGRVFGFEWEMDWGEAVDLHFNGNSNDGFAVYLDMHYENEIPTEISEDDPEQGWGEMTDAGDYSEPYHKVL